MKITFINEFYDPSNASPIKMPIGAIRAKIVIKMKVAHFEKPELAKEAPREIAAAVLWMNIPIDSYQSDSALFINPRATPSKSAWKPIARVNMIAVTFDTEWS